MKSKIDNCNAKFRWFIKIGHDLIFSISAYIISHYILYFFTNVFFQNNLLKLILLAVAQILFLYVFGAYKIVIRFFDFNNIKTILCGVLFGSLSFSLIFNEYISDNPTYLLLLAIQLLGMSLIIIFNRYVISYIYNHNDEKNKAVIYGIGREALQLQAGLRDHSSYRVLAFICADDKFIGRNIGGIPVFGIADVEKIISKLNISNVIIADSNAKLSERRKILDIFKTCKTNVLTTSAILQSSSYHNFSSSDIQELDIDDLLSRESSYDKDLIHTLIYGKRVLITGAGGSIGSELCKQLVKSKPSSIILLDHSELALYSIHNFLTEIKPDCEVVPILGSILDEAILNTAFGKYRPDIVYHAAAYKHVLLSDLNPFQAVTNNVFGTKLLLEYAVKFNIKNFMLVSTDKAVRPTTVMGATKRVAEMIVQTYGSLKLPTSFGVVRFGNVLGSSGSVVPKFREQIRKGGPITITHKDVNRYFMSIPEASQLVLLASSMAKNGEVFLLDMGEPVKIVDLARNMITLSGFTVRCDSNPNGDIEIVYGGLHETEKINEELLISGNKLPTSNKKIYKSFESTIDVDELDNILNNLSNYCQQKNQSVGQYLIDIARQ